jgi:hypothetical protein
MTGRTMREQPEGCDLHFPISCRRPSRCARQRPSAARPGKGSRNAGVFTCTWIGRRKRLAGHSHKPRPVANADATEQGTIRSVAWMPFSSISRLNGKDTSFCLAEVDHLACEGKCDRARFSGSGRNTTFPRAMLSWAPETPWRRHNPHGSTDVTVRRGCMRYLIVGGKPFTVIIGPTAAVASLAIEQRPRATRKLRRVKVRTGD